MKTEIKEKDKALVVGLRSPDMTREAALESFEEIKALSETAGVKILREDFIELRQINPATFIGKGKVEELADAVKALDIDLVIVDRELSPRIGRNLEEEFCVRVLDRPGIILDIFALHATSKEGKLQVELAQYEYLLPRLVRAWTHLSKQRGGGVGLRGPGETQLEVDRRRAREKISRIKKSLQKVESSRNLHRKKRKERPIPTISLVGYTNAGKTTLFNALTDSNMLAVDQLFATLDPKTSKIKLPQGREALLADTVGFIRNLPHQLIEAFKSTFEEARESDLLIHLVDASYPNLKERMRIVDQVLEELGLDHLPLIHIMNKIDLLKEPLIGFDKEDTVFISAHKKQGLEKLLEKIESKLTASLKQCKLFLPHPYGAQMAQLYQVGHVYHQENQEDGLYLEVSLPEKWASKFSSYEV